MILMGQKMTPAYPKEYVKTAPLKQQRAWEHERKWNGKEEWLTPPYILKALGEFDLDPCAPKFRPWDIARKHYTIDDNGLMQKWTGRVWLNPPYGTQTKLWLAKMAGHGNGIALIYARTETQMFFRYIWQAADGIMFLRRRLRFYTMNGEPAKAPCGAPSVLVAYGKENAECLRKCWLDGKYIALIPS